MLMSQMKTLKMKNNQDLRVCCCRHCTHQHGLEAYRSAICGRSGTVLKNEEALLKLFTQNEQVKSFFNVFI